MSSFHETRFPSSISFKAEGGPVFRTEIATLKSGLEKRNIVWSRSRAEYEISYTDISNNETSEIISFFMARRGSAYGFRFKDWNDFQASSEEIATADGATTNFQLIKNYGDDENTYQRIITKPVTDSVSVYVDGNQQQTGVSINYSNGVITFDSPPALGELITADFEFDVPVRFASDMLVAKTESHSKSSIKKIKLLEIKI